MKAYFLLGLPHAEIIIQNTKVEALLDTGFNGAILLPANVIDDLKLKKIGFAEYVMADGAISMSEIFSGEIEWFDKRKKVSVIAAESDLVLVGMELLFETKLLLRPSKNIIEVDRDN